MLHECPLLGPPNMSHLMISLQWNSNHLARWVRDSVTFLPVKALTSENMTFFSYMRYAYQHESDTQNSQRCWFLAVKGETHKDEKKLQIKLTKYWIQV